MFWHRQPRVYIRVQTAFIQNPRFQAYLSSVWIRSRLHEKKLDSTIIKDRVMEEKYIKLEVRGPVYYVGEKQRWVDWHGHACHARIWISISSTHIVVSHSVSTTRSSLLTFAFRFLAWLVFISRTTVSFRCIKPYRMFGELTVL